MAKGSQETIKIAAAGITHISGSHPVCSPRWVTSPHPTHPRWLNHEVSVKPVTSLEGPSLHPESGEGWPGVVKRRVRHRSSTAGWPAGTGARSSSGTQQEEEGGERGREEETSERGRAARSEELPPVERESMKKHISVVSLKGVREWALRPPQGGRALVFRFI